MSGSLKAHTGSRTSTLQLLSLLRELECYFTTKSSVEDYPTVTLNEGDGCYCDELPFMTRPKQKVNNLSRRMYLFFVTEGCACPLYFYMLFCCRIGCQLNLQPCSQLTYMHFKRCKCNLPHRKRLGISNTVKTGTRGKNSYGAEGGNYGNNWKLKIASLI
jgi:hypothetical protein